MKSLWSDFVQILSYDFVDGNICNLGQRVEDKFTKLSKIGFFMKCFTADFLQIFTEKRQNLGFG